MYAKAEWCVATNDPNFVEANLKELERLWKMNSEGLSDEVIWPIYYGVMHWAQGDSVLSVASCLDARSWLAEDFPAFRPATGSAVDSTNP